MSILSDLFNKKITFNQAATEGATWFSAILTHAPAAVQADVASGLSDFKQAASDAAGLADTALGSILSTGTLAVEAAANAAINSALGPFGGVLTPVVDAGITSVTNALHAEIDAVAAQVRAKIVTPAPAPVLAHEGS
jgi:hypothetical protein